MGQEINIRKMVAADLDSVTSIYNEVFNPTYISFGELAVGRAVTPNTPSPSATEIFRNEIAEKLQTSHSGLFVAISMDSIVGFAAARLLATPAGHLECWVDDLGVSLSFRRQGIGEQLVSFVLKWGIDRKAKYFLLESGKKNEIAHRLFERLGFKPASIVFYKGN
jgi:ribosomal protein S18 acetylase RimI-like enzyme